MNPNFCNRMLTACKVLCQRRRHPCSSPSTTHFPTAGTITSQPIRFHYLPKILHVTAGIWMNETQVAKVFFISVWNILKKTTCESTSTLTSFCYNVFQGIFCTFYGIKTHLMRWAACNGFYPYQMYRFIFQRVLLMSSWGGALQKAGFVKVCSLFDLISVSSREDGTEHCSVFFISGLFWNLLPGTSVTVVPAPRLLEVEGLVQDALTNAVLPLNVVTGQVMPVCTRLGFLDAGDLSDLRQRFWLNKARNDSSAAAAAGNFGLWTDHTGEKHTLCEYGMKLYIYFKQLHSVKFYPFPPLPDSSFLFSNGFCSKGTVC